MFEILHAQVFVAYAIAITCCLCASSWYLYKRKRRQRKRKCLMIFTRYPLPGTTKTRLVPSLGEKGAALVQRYMTENILDISTASSTEDIHTEVFYNGGTESQVSYWLDRRKKSGQLSWQPQSEGGLGEKFINAFTSMFSDGAEYVLVVGSDIPGITREIIDEAFDKLEQGYPVVLGKAMDGGYYMIGVTKQISCQLSDLFGGIEWGTERVFEQQMARVRHIGQEAAVLSTMLSDVDIAEDIPIFEEALNINATHLLEPHLTVVIPVYNEKQNIVKTLKNVIQEAEYKNRLDIIVCDGGSTDGTLDIVREFIGQNSIPVEISQSNPGRGPQLIKAAELAKGDNLLFLHVDCTLPAHYDQMIEECLSVPGNVAGSFQFDLDIFNPDLCTEKTSFFFNLKMRIIKYATLQRCKKLELPYGDQGYFMKRQTYDKVGGFDEVYLLEDVLLTEKLKKFGHISVLDVPVFTSARRWIEYGAFRVTFLNLFIMMMYRCGVKPNTLALWYYGDKLRDILDKKHS